jgi:hypothetical protein
MPMITKTIGMATMNIGFITFSFADRLQFSTEGGQAYSRTHLA